MGSVASFLVEQENGSDLFLLGSQRRELGKWTESGCELALPDHVYDLDPLERGRG